ncbi:hypothetical protein AB7M22_002792 [Pseudomonas sp. ADAK2 TE3594]
MELTLRVERQGATDTGDNVRGALHTIGENAGHIKQGLPKAEDPTATLIKVVPTSFLQKLSVARLPLPESARAILQC